MQRTASREEIRELDRRAIEEYAIPSIILMENAGRGASRVIQDICGKGPVSVFCGRGNNGGDGFVVARHLHNWGIKVFVFYIGELSKVEANSDPGINLEIIRRMKLGIYEVRDVSFLEPFMDQIRGSTVIVDALLGTGLSGSVREPIYSVITRLKTIDLPVVAIDIPSGLDANTGEILGITLAAKITTTFALPKKGFYIGDGPRMTGEIVVIDISIPREIL